MAFTKYKKVITRKKHKCSSCGRDICNGEEAKYGVTTDKALTQNIRAEYWCKDCA